MDEDSKIIEGLRENNEVLRAQIRHLEKSLNQAIAGQEEVKMTNNNELQKSKEVIDDLNKKVTSLRSTVDAKNVELLNLQTALGQYYAEIEAKVILLSFYVLISTTCVLVDVESSFVVFYSKIYVHSGTFGKRIGFC